MPAPSATRIRFSTSGAVPAQVPLQLCPVHDVVADRARNRTTAGAIREESEECVSFCDGCFDVAANVDLERAHRFFPARPAALRPVALLMTSTVQDRCHTY